MGKFFWFNSGLILPSKSRNLPAFAAFLVAPSRRVETQWRRKRSDGGWTSSTPVRSCPNMSKKCLRQPNCRLQLILLVSPVPISHCKTCDLLSFANHPNSGMRNHWNYRLEPLGSGERFACRESDIPNDGKHLARAGAPLGEATGPRGPSERQRVS